MFKKNKTAKAPRQNKDITHTISWQQEYTRQLDALFADIERTTDAADRILKLEQLLRDVDNADHQIGALRKYIVNNRTHQKTGQTGLSGYAVGVAAVAIPGAIVFPPIVPFMAVGGIIGFATGMLSTKGRIRKKSEKLVTENADLNAFQALIAAQRTQAAKMLDETVKNCDLEKLPLCERFGEALGSCAPLRERFAKAAADAAKKALEEKAALQEQTPASKKLKISHRPPNA